MCKTNIFLTLLISSTVLSQQSGSIFEGIDEPAIVTSDPSEEASDQVQEPPGPLSDNSEVIQTGSDTVTNPNTKDTEAEKSTIPVGDMVKKQDTESTTVETSTNPTEDPKEALITSNQELSDGNQDLEAQLMNSLILLNEYRAKEEIRLKEYTKEIQVLSDVDLQIADSPEIFITPTEDDTTQKQNDSENNNDDDDDDEDEDMEVSLAMIAVIGLGFLFLLLHSLRGL